MQIITGEGQLKKGDKIQIVGKSMMDDQRTTVKEVIHIDGNEEIIIDKRRNRYFITKMLITGESWAKQVCLLPATN